MVAEYKRILVQKGDVLGVHYPKQANEGVVAYYDNTHPSCCGMTDDDLSFIHNDASRDSDVPIRTVMTIQRHYSGKRRLPALKPILSGKFTYIALSYTQYIEAETNYPDEIFKYIFSNENV